jgi:hypothetical protein
MRERQPIPQGDELLSGMLDRLLVAAIKATQLIDGILMEIDGVAQNLLL